MDPPNRIVVAQCISNVFIDFIMCPVGRPSFYLRTLFVSIEASIQKVLETIFSWNLVFVNSLKVVTVILFFFITELETQL